jgi:hypothetical protein
MITPRKNRPTGKRNLSAKARQKTAKITAMSDKVDVMIHGVMNQID